MAFEPTDIATPVRVICIEDNPLLIFHLEQMIEDLGYVFAGGIVSFAELQEIGPGIAMDVALVDIDLCDGPTGPAAAEWLSARGIPAMFMTGQEAMAAQHASKVLGTVSKPVQQAMLASALALLGDALVKTHSGALGI